MQISLRAPGAALTYSQIKERREAAEALAARRRDDAERGASKTLSSGRLGVIEQAKHMARAKIEAVREKIKVIKQLFGANPLGMAKALAQLFKEMKSAVKDFREATAQQMDGAGEGVRSTLAQEEAEAAKAENEAKAVEKTEGEPEARPEDAAGRYDETVQATRKLIGEEGYEFIKEVRAVMKKLQELLETARLQAKARKQDDQTDEAFKDADGELKALNEQLDAMAEDIRRAAPTAGMKLSVAA